jgi:hypothetical protein
MRQHGEWRREGQSGREKVVESGRRCHSVSGSAFDFMKDLKLVISSLRVHLLLTYRLNRVDWVSASQSVPWDHKKYPA